MVSNSRQMLASLNFCVIDLETTGGNHDSDQIIEVGLVRIRNLQIEKGQDFLVNPQKNIPEFIQKLTSIKQADVEDSPTIDLIIDQVIDFIGDDIIVAHNTSFDVPFLNSVLRRLGRKELKNKVICTNVMTKHMIPEIMTSNLNYMSNLFNINHSNAHRAKDDAMATAKLLLKFLEIFESKGIKKVNQLYYPRNKFELDRVHIKKDETSIDEIENIIISQNNTPMSVSLKGNRGLILANIPLNHPAEEVDLVLEIMSDVDWDIMTIRLTSPLLDSFFQFNNHLQKYDPKARDKVLSYLTSRYTKSENKVTIKLEDLDIIIGHHLVRNQVSVFNFLNLNTNSKHLFKIPAQKKKMFNYILGQVKRFKNNQNKLKRSILHTELYQVIESIINDELSQGKLLHVPSKNLKNNENKIIKEVEQFVAKNPTKTNFPNKHL